MRKDGREGYVTSTRAGAVRTGHGAVGVALVLFATFAAAPAARADSIQDVVANPQPPFNSFSTVFPNWYRVPTASFTIVECTDAACAWCLNGPIVGVTMFNYGTATGGAGGDISGMNFLLLCNTTNSGFQPMTYAGAWTVGADTYPAWTWAGSIPWSADPCGGCACRASLFVYTDISPCPADGTTIELGPGLNSLLNPANPGGITDSCGMTGPWLRVTDGMKDIRYVTKVADRDTALPGDTINYTIYHGLPGTNAISSIVIMDTQPPYTHLVSGSPVPAADPGYEPDPGPPPRIRWTRPGGAPAGGATREVRFSLTVDWGNTESFEPGSGDVAAPEGYRLNNRAYADFEGSNCPVKSMVSFPTSTTVRRFMFWKIGDNDLLFASSVGIPDDEMVYTIFMKNLSSERTWWNVVVWDSVPAELDAWNTDCGMEDPCVGWTMTPTGCAAAAAGRIVTAAKNTILTWRLDMPPLSTLTVRWKAKVRPSATAGSTAINRASIQAMGSPAKVGGTGNSGEPKNFTHLALVKLRTTYTSYVSYAASVNGCPGYMLDFFPLNKMTQFELRGIQYSGAGWAAAGGVSQSIGCFIGDCMGGFPGNGGCTLGQGTLAIPGGGMPGCKAERIPPYYLPSVTLCTAPFNFIYKLTSNSPIVWQMLTKIGYEGHDRHTYMPSSSLSFSGYTMYGWMGTDPDASSLGIINTSSSSPTTVHLFRFDYTLNEWIYKSSYDLDVESQASHLGCAACGDWAPWRVISSDAPLIVHQGEWVYTTLPGANCCCNSCDNHGAFAPSRETGYTTGSAGTTFYGMVSPSSCGAGNGLVIFQWAKASAAPCTFNLYTYTPISTAGNASIPPLLRGTSGTWNNTGSFTLAPGLATSANNPIILTGGPLARGGNNLIKVQVTSGGPIAVNHGADMFSVWSGGAVIQSWDTKANVPYPSGAEFWISHSEGRNDCGVGFVQFFTPMAGTRIGMYSSDGASSEYTTTGPDQCVLFRKLTALSNPVRRNLVFVDKTVGTAMIGLYNQCEPSEKGFTAPPLSTGTYYEIIAPPVVYIGQQVWLTVVVKNELGGVVTNYTGTSSFTSTDPGSQIQGVSMGSYDYVWTGSGGGNDNGVRIFFQVTFTKLGFQTIVASDINDGSITGLAAVMVVGVDVKLTKEPRLAIAASGDTVTFRICWSNYSSGSAFTFVITDAVPIGTTFLPEAVANYDCGSTDGVTFRVAYSDSTSATPPAAFTTVPSGTVGTANTRWLRWTVPMTGVQTTGCACFRVTVN